MSGFQIVHRYATGAPAEGEPVIVCPQRGALRRRARNRRDRRQVFAGTPARKIAKRASAAGWKRIGVYGLDYIMTVRD